MSVPFFESERSLAEQSNGHYDSQILICKKSCNALDEVIASERQRLLKVMKIIAAVCGVVLLLFRVPIVAECWCRRVFDPNCRFRVTHLKLAQPKYKQRLAGSRAGSIEYRQVGQFGVGGNTRPLNQTSLRQSLNGHEISMLAGHSSIGQTTQHFGDRN